MLGQQLRYAIVGMVYCNTEQYVNDQLKVGTKLRLARDHNNAADKFAIGIWEGEKLIGYVTKHKQAELYRYYQTRKGPMTNDSAVVNKDGVLSHTISGALADPVSETMFEGTFIKSANSSYPMIELA